MNGHQRWDIQKKVSIKWVHRDLLQVIILMPWNEVSYFIQWMQWHDQLQEPATIWDCLLCWTYQRVNIIVHQRTVMVLNCYCTVQMSCRKYRISGQPLRMDMRRESLSNQLYPKHHTLLEAFHRGPGNVYLRVKTFWNSIGTSIIGHTFTINFDVFKIFLLFPGYIQGG